MNSPDIYTSFHGLNNLKAEINSNGRSPELLDKAAVQFESLFLQMMLKSMRAASTVEGGLFDSDDSNLYQDLFDSQLALTLAGKRSLGIADLIRQQLEYPVATSADTNRYTGPVITHESPQSFVREIWPQALQAGREMGIDPRVLIAQAALETGWGSAVISHSDGRSSHNLFGIKAGPEWSGERVTHVTTEYEDGNYIKRKDVFRSYNSYSEAFDDYVNFMRKPRYKEVLDKASEPSSYGHALQTAGYATDHAYGSKLEAILDGNTLALALSPLKFEPELPNK